MKKFTLTNFLLGLCMLSFSQTNIYHKFPTSNAVWNETTTNYVFQSSDASCSHYQNVITGDTIVGSYTYHKLWKSGLYYSECFPPPNFVPAHINNYLGAYREDTINKVVYFLIPGKSTDTLLYDFNLKLGDILPKSYINNVINTVTKVDSFLVGNKYRRRFGMTSHNWSGGYDSNYVYLIEGIGSTFGFENNIRPLAEVPSGSTLNCFKQNGLTVFPDTITTCSIIMSTDDKGLANNNNTEVFPNPIKNVTEILFNKTFKNITVEVFDLLGKSVEEFEYYNCSKINFNRNNLNNGIYFLKISFENKSYEIKKIIVSE